MSTYNDTLVYHVMEKQKIYAAITGDIVGSTSFSMTGQWEKVLAALKSSFGAVKDTFPASICAPFTIYRGDSFQGVLDKPDLALRAVLIIRASLCAGFEFDHRRLSMDARIAIGIGSIDFLPRGLSSEGDGEAFRLSGPCLDSMKAEQRLVIRTCWPQVHAEFDAECALLDAVISKWSVEQAQAIRGQMQNLTQQMVAQKLGISQPAVQQRLKHAGGWAVSELCRRYEELISQLLQGDKNHASTG